MKTFKTIQVSFFALSVIPSNCCYAFLAAPRSARRSNPNGSNANSSSSLCLYRFIWELSDDKVDSDVVSDLLLESGAWGAELLSNNNQGVEVDTEFHKTGKLASKNNWSRQLVVSVSDKETAPNIVQMTMAIMKSSVNDDFDDDHVMESSEWELHCRDYKEEEIDNTDFTSHSDELSDANEDEEQTNKTVTVSVSGHELQITHSLTSQDWAFGDGNHPSTRLSLRGLEMFATSGLASVLDFGCGTGILACAAFKLGACRVTAVDISPEALMLTRHNRDVNGCQLDVLHSEEFTTTVDGQQEYYDVVVANIPSNTLKMLLPVLSQACCEDGGYVLLSGYPTHEAEGVTEAAANIGLKERDVHARLYDSGWVLQVFQK